MNAYEFWSRFDITDPDQCWVWPLVSSSVTIGGRDYTCGQAAYIFANGLRSLPPHVRIFRRCGTEKCCNPRHFDLRAVYPQTVIEDQPLPVYRPTTTKLTDAAVRAIRRRYAAGGVTQKQLAEEYGVSRTLISGIVRRVGWQHVA